MKKLLAIILALALLLPTFALADVFAAEGATITVSGSASVTLKADYAQVTVGVSTKAPTVEEASAKNTAAIHAVITALTEAGVLEDDIATSNYSVGAEYDYSAFGTQTLTGYNVSNQLNVIIRDMDHIGATLDKATAAGANSIHSVEFCSSLSADAQDSAMILAVQEAIRKGQLLAAAASAGRMLGDIISITETTGSVYTTPVMYKVNAEADTVSNVILPDALSISASVTITFAME